MLLVVSTDLFMINLMHSLVGRLYALHWQLMDICIAILYGTMLVTMVCSQGCY